jgi:hypothetical protein
MTITITVQMDLQAAARILTPVMLAAGLATRMLRDGGHI